jgi:hypothetical protein
MEEQSSIWTKATTTGNFKHRKKNKKGKRTRGGFKRTKKKVEDFESPLDPLLKLLQIESDYQIQKQALSVGGKVRNSPLTLCIAQQKAGRRRKSSRNKRVTRPLLITCCGENRKKRVS